MDCGFTRDGASIRVRASCAFALLTKLCCRTVFSVGRLLLEDRELSKGDRDLPVDEDCTRLVRVVEDSCGSLGLFPSDDLREELSREASGLLRSVC